MLSSADKQTANKFATSYIAKPLGLIYNVTFVVIKQTFL